MNDLSRNKIGYGNNIENTKVNQDLEYKFNTNSLNKVSDKIKNKKEMNTSIETNYRNQSKIQIFLRYRHVII